MQYEKENTSAAGLQPWLPYAAARRRPGQALVETALLLPILILLLLPLLDFAFAMHASTTMINAARDGVRAAIDTSVSDANVKSLVQAVAAPYSVATADIVVTRNTASTPKQASVQVTYRYTAIFPFTRNLWGGGTRNITYRRVARIP